MNSLEIAVQNALEQQDEPSINKAYLEFLKANFIVPIEVDSSEDPKVLFITEAKTTFLPVFSSYSYLNQWALEIADSIQILELTGVNLLKGIGEQITVCLNVGSTLYKEFNPQEIARMKNMVAKLFK